MNVSYAHALILMNAYGGTKVEPELIEISPGHLARINKNQIP